MNAKSLVVLVLVFAVAMSACSRRQTEWEAARAADTVESYERFLAAFPDGEFSTQAQARATELREARDWKNAVAANTLGAYQQFIAQYPDGRMSDEARIRIESFTLASAAPAPLQSQTTPAPVPQSTSATVPQTLPATLPQAPDAARPSPGAATVAPPSSGGGFRIQLGAFSGGDKQAMGEWRRLQREYPQLLSGLSPTVKLATTTSGHLYRLQAGTMSEARAREICTKLQDEGQACVVVVP